MSQKERFHITLIKPSHYDDEGYVIQWKRSAIPSNSLAALYAIAMDSARRKVLGSHIEIRVDAYDETNTVIPIKKIIKQISKEGKGLVGLVGVQTNQFPRAVDLGVAFVKAGIPVIIGGFHVSGSLAMLPETPVEIHEAMKQGLSMFAGEAEHHFNEVLRDTNHKGLKPLYNFVSDNPSLQGTPTPFLPASIVQKTFRRLASFDAGRGCPFQCSFCTIINVQGRTSRWRSADDIEALVRTNFQQGIRRFFITDDDFARNKGWEEILDRLIQLREKEGIPLSLAIQVDTVCHKIPRFIEKAVRAGCFNVFMGLETLNPRSLSDAKKRQNKIWEYRSMLQAWKQHGCTTVAGYIIGFPHDTAESIARDIDIIKRELPIDLLEFFCWTPLPGSEDHKDLYLRQIPMSSDMNAYDLEHVTVPHPRMSKEEWQHAYQNAWTQYYTLDHCETLMRRAAAKGQSVVKVMFFLLCFYGSITFEGIHPLEGGMFRWKVRAMRRPGFPKESPLPFYAKMMREVLQKTFEWTALWWKLNRLRQRIERDPQKLQYTDLAISPVTEQSEEKLELIGAYAQHIPLSKISKRAKSPPDRVRLN